MVLRKGEYILTEKYELQDSKDSVIIEGLALPLGKPSRNRYLYTRESVKNAYKTLEGKPILFNHDENRVIGHVESVWMEDHGLYYRANIDPEERDIVRKLKRGDINKVSIQAIVENLQPDGDYVKADIREFLELSVVTIPGFEDTTLELKEKYLGGIMKTEESKSKYVDDNGQFKEMTCPDNPDEKSRFCGCVRWAMSEKGLSLESAKKLCAYIGRKAGKISFDPNDSNINVIAEFLKEVDNMDEKRVTEQEDTETPSTDMDEVKQLLNDIKAKLSELDAKYSDLEARVSQLESEKPKTPEPEETENTEESYSRKTVVVAGDSVRETVKVSEIYKALRGE